MNTKTLFKSLVAVICALFVEMTLPVTVSGGDDLLAKFETGDKEFKRVKISDMIVYFHQRMIDEAIVEGDCIIYQFDGNTGELLNKEIRWRSDLPEHVTPLITKEEAESMVRGDVQFTRLYIISPESDVFPLKPTPQNPCWVVRSVDDGELIVTIIDGVDSKTLGYGIPPPYTGFSLSGPQYSDPCSGTWTSWYQNAEYWFNEMGYSTEAVEWPTEAKVKSHIQSCATAMFYELAHGGSYYFASGCPGGTNYEFTYSSEIHNWIEDYTKMPFAFIGSCEGMCDVGSGSFSYEFRKGSMEGTATVGYCHMSEPECEDAWISSLDWQDVMFFYMKHEYTVKEAFDWALVAYPECVDCMRFTGDESLAVVPIVERCKSVEFIRGDYDEDGSMLTNDPIMALQWIFGVPGAPPSPCADAADYDDDGAALTNDPIMALQYIFGVPGAPPPQPPFGIPPGDCGPDPTEDGLDCASYPPCGTKGVTVAYKPSVSVKGAENRLMVGEVTVADGVVRVPVDLTLSEVVCGFDISLGYDVSSLQFKEVVGGDGYDFYAVDTREDGVVRIGCVPDIEMADLMEAGTHRVGEILFTVEKKADMGLSWKNVEVYGSNVQPLSVEWVVKAGAGLPKEFALSQNYPNPFNPTTLIKYELPLDCQVKLDIYNVVGQRVTTLVDGHQKAGYKTATWNAQDLASGVYFYKLTAGDFTSTRKMVLLK